MALFFCSMASPPFFLSPQLHKVTVGLKGRRHGTEPTKPHPTLTSRSVYRQSGSGARGLRGCLASNRARFTE
jgi:hypothetical protein